MKEVRDALELDKKENEKNSSKSITSKNIEAWYENRLYEIESLSDFVDNSLKLCELAIRNGCKKKFTKLYDNILTLSTLIYECKSDNKLLTLKYIQELSELEQMKLILSNYDGDLTNDLYGKRIQDWLLPYIERRDSNAERENLVKQYLLFKSKN